MKKILLVALLLITTLTLVGCFNNEVHEEDVYYTITFDSNGGSIINNKKVLRHDKLEQPTAPFYEGFEFKGWYEDQEFKDRYNFNTIVVEDFTLYAKWEEEIINDIYYTVNFVTNGSTEINPIQIKENEKLNSLEEPVREGFVFKGWYTDKNFTNVYDFNSVVRNDFTIYLKWEEKTVSDVYYTVTFNSNGGSFIESSKVKDNEKLDKPENPVKSGFKFIHWFIDENLSMEYNFNNLVDKDFTLYAKWEEVIVSDVYYTVTFNSNGGSFVESLSVKKGLGINKPDDPIKEEYIFLGWYINQDLTLSYSFGAEVKKDFTLYAKWEKVIVPDVYYTVTFDTNGGSIINDILVIENNKLIKPNNPKRSGYTFLGWFTNSNFETSYDFNSLVKKDFVLYAKWEENSDDVDVGDWFE